MIELRDVAYAYPDTDHYVLDGVDLTVARGEVVGVIGASGVGKTTLAKIIAGFIPNVEGGTLDGSVAVDDVPISSLPLAEAVAQVGLVIQNPFNQISGAKFSVREEIVFGLENTGVPRDEMITRVTDVAALLRIDHLLDRSPYALSGGQMQLVAIASVIVMGTPVLVMDEPTSQLDPGGSRMVFDVISALTDAGTSVLIFEHKVELLREHADRIAVLAEGRIIHEGTPRAVLTDDRLESWSVGSTRYTRAARAARGAGIVHPDAALPVSLSDSTEYFTTQRTGR
ncbi:ABC transporter ATP-binding protein [Rhodoglobus aureus]|uniref:ABC transporter ATP-binding protein n=1 Tax=Rhodoglobus aureus TaxID=191497 RepID=A0ABN1W280_9MICO